MVGRYELDRRDMARDCTLFYYFRQKTALNILESTFHTEPS